MRWTPGGDSSNVEDRRGESGEGGGGGGGRRVGLAGGAVLLVLSLVFGRNLFTDLGVSDVGGVPAAAPAATSSAAAVETPDEKTLVDFVTFVLNDAQGTWKKLLGSTATPYRDARLVLFRNSTRSGCGDAESAMGPFYCPVDEKVYIDLGFYDELRRRFGAPGDFAQAYVIAHELGHHVQKILGTEPRVRAMQERNPSQANALSVMMELQADCYAGVWGRATEQRKILDQGDVNEGLAAAAAVGDDRLQQQSGGRIHPESFTHGSSAQRTQWFSRGFQSGDLNSCDTFAAGR